MGRMLYQVTASIKDFVGRDYDPCRAYENRALNLGKDLEEIQLTVDGKMAARQAKDPNVIRLLLRLY